MLRTNEELALNKAKESLHAQILYNSTNTWFTFGPPGISSVSRRA